MNNKGKIENIIVTAINNNGSPLYGDAASVIYNTTIDAEIASIQGTFIGNHNNVGKSAILNDNGARIGSIKGVFIGNSIQGVMYGGSNLQ